MSRAYCLQQCVGSLLDVLVQENTMCARSCLREPNMTLLGLGLGTAALNLIASSYMSHQLHPAADLADCNGLPNYLVGPKLLTSGHGSERENPNDFIDPERLASAWADGRSSIEGFLARVLPAKATAKLMHWMDQYVAKQKEQHQYPPYIKASRRTNVQSPSNCSFWEDACTSYFSSLFPIVDSNGELLEDGGGIRLLKRIFGHCDPTTLQPTEPPACKSYVPKQRRRVYDSRHLSLKAIHERVD